MINTPKISVIITAHDRKEYLANAIGSVINQTVEKSNYEVIVIKNFEDEGIDDIIRKEAIISIRSEDNSKIGEDLYLGIINSHADIICFLDDDDLFTSDKLENVLKAFFDYPDISLYVNGRSYIRDDLTEITYKDFGYDYDREFFIDKDNQYMIILLPVIFNMSSMCIKKSILIDFISHLKTVSFSPDDFMLYLNLCNQGFIYRDNKKLTIYRIHASSSQAGINQSFEEFIINKRKILQARLKAYEYLNNIFAKCNSKLLKDGIFFFTNNVKMELLFSSDNIFDIKLTMKEFLYHYQLLVNSLFHLMIKPGTSKRRILKFYLGYQMELFIYVLTTTLGFLHIGRKWTLREYGIKSRIK